jgi:ribosomal protein S18 acetylase RimI-like enzyme
VASKGSRDAISAASVSDINELAVLFDDYRQFYGEISDVELAKRYLFDRISNRQSIVLVGRRNGRIAGFVQLYPVFSSLKCRPSFVLNDLFVDETHRGSGLGAHLLTSAANYARDVGAASLSLMTQKSNAKAISLYERSGWRREQDFYTYELAL